MKKPELIRPEEVEGILQGAIDRAWRKLNDWDYATREFGTVPSDPRAHLGYMLERYAFHTVAALTIARECPDDEVREMMDEIGMRLFQRVNDAP